MLALPERSNASMDVGCDTSDFFLLILCLIFLMIGNTNILKRESRCKVRPASITIRELDLYNNFKRLV